MANVLQIAQGQVGVQSYNNNVKYNTWFYGHAVSGSNYAWCAVFISWCFKQAGIYSRISGVASKGYVPSWVDWAKKTHKWAGKPRVGELVIFDWNGNGQADHIGILESTNRDGSVNTIEGNTGQGNNSNGGRVMRRTRAACYVLGYVAVDINPPAARKTKVYATGQIYCYGTNRRYGWKLGGRTGGHYCPDNLISCAYVERKDDHYAVGTVKCYETHPVKGWNVSPTSPVWIKAHYIHGARKV